ncbi:RICIN domain-containing protein [Kribbella sp. NPDC003505]|uniref:RICIN domain-containing protein n=1 Tax=Kribbella sp. NPDC003505 TaxID=3154448 RepID=UPI0033A7589D
MRINRFIGVRRVVAAIVVAAVTVTAIVVPAGTAQAVPGIAVVMVNMQSGRYLTIGNASHTDGAPAIQWTSLPGYEQRWNFVKVRDEQEDYWDEWIITNAHSGDCLAIPAGSGADGAGVIQWTCATNPFDGRLGIDDQRWWIWYDWLLRGYRIMNLKSGKCLAIPNGTTALGVQAIQWSCADDLDQRWWIS